MDAAGRGHTTNGAISPNHSEVLALDVIEGHAVPRVAVAPAMLIADHPAMVPGGTVADKRKDVFSDYWTLSTKVHILGA